MDVTPGLNYDRAQIGLTFLVQLMGDMEKLVLVDRTVSELARFSESLAEHTDLCLGRLTMSGGFRLRRRRFSTLSWSTLRTSYKAVADGNITDTGVGFSGRILVDVLDRNFTSISSC
jgi:hypothetical protein